MSEPIPIVLTLPPSSHPEAIRGEFLDKDPQLVELARAPMKLAYETVGTIEPLAREVRDTNKLAQHAQPRFEQVVKRYAHTIDQLARRRESVAKEIDQRVVGTGVDPIHAEVRAHLKAQPDGGLTLAMKAARLGERRTVQAVLQAPAYLSGMSEDEHARFRAVAAETLEPELTGLARDLDANLARVQKASEAFTEHAVKLLNRWRSHDDDIISARLGKRKEK
jgi:hypothetical protein